MKLTPLGEVSRIVSGATPKTGVEEYWNGDIQWATPADLNQLDGAYLATTPRTLTAEGLASCAATQLPPNSVLLSSRAPIGHVAINTVPMSTNQGFKSLIPRAGVLDSKYLYYWLKSKTEYLQGIGNGATFKEISREAVARVCIPLLSIEEQRRVAAILDVADSMRTKRVHALALSDSLNAAVFAEANSKSAIVPRRLDSLIDADDRINYGVLQPGLEVAGGVPLIRVSNLRNGLVDRLGLKRIDPEVEKRYNRSRIRGNEILVSCVGSIGLVSVVRSDDVGSNVARAVSRVPISDPAVRAYVAAYLKTAQAQNYFRAELRTVAQPTLNVKQLAATLVPIPSRQDMKEFHEKASSISQHRAILESAVKRADELFASLHARAFRGDL